MSRVDVIIPCYRYAHYLGACVESVLGQSHADLRVLILDDASPDHTPEVASALVARDPRVEYRRHEANRRHIATYNEGLDWASGDYALLLSADDELVPGALARAAALMDAHPEVGLVYGRQIHFSTERPPARPDPGPCSGRVLGGEGFIRSFCESGSNPVATPTAVVRTALQKALGGYRADLPHTADMELWLRFGASAAVGVLDADQAFKRQHASNMQHDYVGTSLGDIAQRKAAFDVFFAGTGSSIEGRAELRALADRAIAWEAFWAASEAIDRGDPARCRELLDFAVGFEPGLKDSPEWSRLAVKRRLGPTLWAAIRPVVERVRGRASAGVSRSRRWADA
jgi:glycosyltransferase involved in cell wall biosynthesis